MSWLVALPLAVAALFAGVLLGAIIGMLVLRVIGVGRGWARQWHGVQR